MIRFLLLVLFALALGASAAYYIRADAGYVLLSYRDWSLETSLLGFALALALLLLALKYGVRVAIAGLRLPAILRQAVTTRRERRARSSFETGLAFWLDGRWQQAEVELVRRAADHPANGLNYLLAAEAAQRLGAPERSERYLQQAAESHAVGVLLVRAERAMQKQDWPAARELLFELREQDPTHETMLERLAEVHSQTSDWEALSALLALATTQKALGPERIRAWQLRLARGRLDAALAVARLDQFKSTWESLSAPLRFTSELRRYYIQGLLRLNAEAEAAALIEASLREIWDAELVRLYGEAQGLDALSALASAENWLGQYGEKPELLWLAARACLRNKLWGKARSYLDGLVRVAPSAVVYLELARLSEQTQNPEDAARFYRLGLETAVIPERQK